MNIDWLSDQSHILAPRKHSLDQPSLKDWPNFLSHIWILTSGSDGKPKWVGLSKDAFLSSAYAVNLHLNVAQEDIWLNILPTSHVGGLAIYARAQIGKNKVIDRSNIKWNALGIVQTIHQEQVTLASMVPTQVYDLVDQELSAPESLRAVIVGGGHLTPSLYKRARQLGWPVLPSYGMTESCSQVATAGLESLNQEEYPNLEILSHAALETRNDSRIWIQGKSLLTGYMVQASNNKWNFVDPKVDGWFKTTDLGEIKNHQVHKVWREGNSIKLKGELVSMPEIENLWQAFALEQKVHARIQWMPLPHERDENQIIALCDRRDWVPIQRIWPQFLQARLNPMQQPSGLFGLVDFPVDPMGKWPKEKIRRLLGY